MNIIEEIAKEIANNRLIPFAGAGISLSHIHVDWNEICGKMNEITGYTGDDNLEAAQQLVDKIDKVEFCKFLKNYFYIENFNDLLGENHLFLMALNYARYYTTNQDNIFEKCFEKYHRPLHIVSDTEDFENYNPKNQVLYKFHGALEKPETVVFCKNDYKERMPDKELSSLNPLDIQLMADTIAKGIIFIGYSFKDPNIKFIFKHIGKITKGHKHNFYLIEYVHNEDFVNYLKQYNIIAVNPCDFFPGLSVEEAYSSLLKTLLEQSYKKQTEFFWNNVFNDTTITRIKIPYEVEAITHFLEDENVDIQKKITQFRQSYDLSVVPYDCGRLYEKGFKALISVINADDIQSVLGGLQNSTVENFESAINCLITYYKKLNTIQIKDDFSKIHYINVHIKAVKNIKHINLFAQAAALEEILNEKQDPSCFLSFIQMCAYSKDTVKEIEDGKMKEYIVTTFQKAYALTNHYSNPFETSGLWFKTSSFEDIMKSMLDSIPKPADYR